VAERRAEVVVLHNQARSHIKVKTIIAKINGRLKQLKYLGKKYNSVIRNVYDANLTQLSGKYI